MPLRLITSTDPEALLRAAAEGFLTPRPASASVPFPTVPYLLALRQGGLRDDLFDLAAGAGIPGWFDPPLCIFHELAERLGVAPRSILGEYERAVLLGRILRDSGSQVFARLKRPDVFVDAVDVLFGELLSNGVTPDGFRNALNQRADRDDFLRRRDEDLHGAYEAYVRFLASNGKADGRDEWQYCATEIASGRANLAEALGGRREIRIFGLADLRRGWRQLLQALSSAPSIDSVIVYSSSALDIGVAGEPLGTTSSAIAAMASRLFAEDAADQPSSVTPVLVGAPDVEREHDEIARRIRALVDAGTATSRIAVVTRKARPHLDHAVAALTKVGVPVMARQRFALNTIPVVRAIRTLFQSAAEGWTRAALIEIVRQPYIQCAIEPRVINHIGFRRRVVGLADWEVALRGLETETRRREQRIADGTFEGDERGSVPPPSEMVVSTRETLSAFMRNARAMDNARPMAGWLTWLIQALQRDTFGIKASAHVLAGGRFDIIRRDLAALDGVLGIAMEWRDALANPILHGTDDDAPVSPLQFHDELTAFLSGDAAIWTPAVRGVQVLEGSAAAYRCFDHVFITGMQAGAVPAPAPQSPILDERERVALANVGLPIDTAAVWDARERELFRVLSAGARHTLTYSYARLDDAGREVMRSSFVEAVADVVSLEEQELPTSRVIIDGTPLYSSAASVEQAVHGATIEQLRATGSLSRYNGSIESEALVAWLATEFGDDRMWSPTQLEDFAKCPWAFFSKRALRLELRDDPDEDMDPATRGSVLHLALRRFFEGAKVRIGGPVFLMPADSAWVVPALESALDAALEESSWRWLGHPELQAAKRAELSRILRGFIEWEMDLHFDMTDPTTKKRNAPKMVRTGADEHELAFDDVVFERDGVRIRYRGSIDRVDVSVDERLGTQRFVAAIDYKTSKFSTPGGGQPKAWDDGVVLQVPLYAHALHTLRPDSDIARVEYQSLKKPERVHSLELYTVDKNSKVLTKDEEAQAKLEGALDHAIAHVRSARRGDFPAEPPSVCSCPPWCHGRDICRIPGGPRELR